MKLIGPLYVGTLKYYHRKPLPIIEQGWTQETEHPFRKGKCYVFRAPFTLPGFYIGKWVPGTELNHEDDDAIDARFAEVLVAKDAETPTKTIRGW
jgi:hypothetical protein